MVRLGPGLAHRPALKEGGLRLRGRVDAQPQPLWRAGAPLGAQHQASLGVELQALTLQLIVTPASALGETTGGVPSAEASLAPAAAPVPFQQELARGRPVLADALHDTTLEGTLASDFAVGVPPTPESIALPRSIVSLAALGAARPPRAPQAHAHASLERALSHQPPVGRERSLDTGDDAVDIVQLGPFSGGQGDHPRAMTLASAMRPGVGAVAPVELRRTLFRAADPSDLGVELTAPLPLQRLTLSTPVDVRDQLSALTALVIAGHWAMEPAVLVSAALLDAPTAVVAHEGAVLRPTSITGAHDPAASGLLNPRTLGAAQGVGRR